MRWVKSSEGTFYLVVAPLHGKDNKDGEGAGVKILAYEYPGNNQNNWQTYILDAHMHLTHNFDFVESPENNRTTLFIAGKEGIRYVEDHPNNRPTGQASSLPGIERAAGEVRFGTLPGNTNFIATIEPMHGKEVAVYLKDKNAKRILLDDNLNEGHALATADFLGIGGDQVVAGWRNPNKEGKVGIKLYIPQDASYEKWKSQWIDENDMACEDIQVMDLNGDGKPDIVASGRATKNLKIYWNKSGKN
jgi:hypothetical protein